MCKKTIATLWFLKKDNITEFYVLAGIALIVLQVLLIVKFFQMASDIKTIKTIQMKDLPTAICAETFSGKVYVTSSSTPVDYVVENNLVKFSTGKSDKIVRYDGVNECSFVINNTQELMYCNVYDAIDALYVYLYINEIRTKGLIAKRVFRGSLQDE